jgi:hypothetical protein
MLDLTQNDDLQEFKGEIQEPKFRKDFVEFMERKSLAPQS